MTILNQILVILKQKKMSRFKIRQTFHLIIRKKDMFEGLLRMHVLENVYVL